MTSPPTPSLGYGNDTGKELSLDQLVNILCTPAEFDDGVVPTILVVHDRGTKGGDEERLRALGVDMSVTQTCTCIITDCASETVPFGTSWTPRR